MTSEGVGDSMFSARFQTSRDAHSLRASQKFSGTHSRLRPPMYIEGSTDLSERLRLVLTVSITFLYLVLLGAMFYAVINPVKATMKGEERGGRWYVTWILPAGSFYENNVRPGDIILKLDGQPVTNPTANDIGAQHSTVTVLLRSGAVLQPLTFGPTDDNALRRWTFALLGLIFMGVGGPVFVKARQRTAASAFYVFCLSTAVSLSLGLGIASNVEWVQALLFVSLVIFAGSFAFFFFTYPVQLGRTKRKHNIIMTALVATGLFTTGCYIWVLSGHIADYDWVRLVLILYIVGCLGAGIASLVRTMIAEKSTQIRQQLMLLLGGTAFAVGPSLLLSVIPQMFYKEIVSVYLTSVVLGIMPLAFAYAITQHQLLGIRGFVRRSVVYVVMGSSVLLVFSLAASVLSAVNQGWEHTELGLMGFGLFVFLMAFSFGYLQRRVEHYVDRFIYHDAYDYKEALLQFSSQLASQQDLEVLANQLVERTCRLMNLVCGVLVLGVHDDDERSTFGSESGSKSVQGPGGKRLHSMLTMSSLDLAADAKIIDIPAWLSGITPQSSHEDGAYGSPGNQQSSGVCLQVYAKYGHSADTMVAGLRDELSRQGIGLVQPDGSLVPVVYSEGASDSRAEVGGRHSHSSIVESSASAQVGSITDAVANTHVTEILSTRQLGNGRNDGAVDMARSFLGVPLWTRSRFVGVLCLAGKKTGERFTKDDLSLLSTLGSQAALAIYNAQLSEARAQALLDTIASLAHAIEAKDGYTSEHCERMTHRAVAVAQCMGLSKQEVENVRLGAMLHDVGKIGVPDAVLNKPGKLTTEEYEIIKQHATIGANIVRSVKALQGVVPIIMHHQERFDGSGYPAGLSGKSIPLGSRIIGVVDTYGAMTENRVYRAAPGHDRAVSELKLLAGKQFDPAVVQAFLQVLEEHPELGEYTYAMQPRHTSVS